MKVLFVGGTWNEDYCEKGGYGVIYKKTYQNPIDIYKLRYTYGKSSHLVDSVVEEIVGNMSDEDSLACFNGGRYSDLEDILKTTSEYDYVFWWANVSNDLPKIRNVKDIAPYVMFINSKRDDEDRYSFQELIQRSLVAKANLTWKFKKIANKIFEITIFDPLGSVWFKGTDIKEAVNACLNRIMFLKSMTRQPSIKTNKIDIIPDEQNFVDVVRKYATEFQKYMDSSVKTERFIGNASLRFIKPFRDSRCGKGMPSFRGSDNMIFVSKRNIDKQFIELDNFVPVYMNDDRLMYCGNDKPSVDTPVQIRLYKAFPQINYMLHSHCYIKNAPFTRTAIPCGAIEEADEVINALASYKIDNKIPQMFAINLIGHGSIVMWNNMEQFHKEIEPTLEYYKRDMPEIMY